MDWGYEYFCSANVVIEVEGMPLTEAVGLRLSIMESKRPIYGYSSRHYDAVASGQVLVEGALVLNYVDQNYLFKALQMGLANSGQLKLTSPPPALNLASELQDQIRTTDGAKNLLQQYVQDPTSNKEISDAFKQSVWGIGGALASKVPVITPSPHDSYPGIDIKVTFGTREIYNLYTGLTNFVVQNAHFLGRSLPITVGEDVIIEEFPFFARNILQIDNQYNIVYGQEGAKTDSTTNTVSIGASK